MQELDVSLSQLIIYSLPLVGALVGWSTNYVAVKMLFHPRNPKRFLFLTFHGVFPKRQAALAEKLGEVVARDLLSDKDIAESVAKSIPTRELVQNAENRIEYLLTERLPAAIPGLAFFLTPSLIASVKSMIDQELSDLIQSSHGFVGEQIAKGIDVRSIVTGKVAAFSSDELEKLLFSLMKKEFRFIEVIGAVLGFFIGLIQLALTVLSQ